MAKRDVIHCRTNYTEADVDGAEEVVDVVLVVGARRLRDLLEVAPEALETLHLVQLLGRVHHRELVVVIPADQHTATS